MTANEIDLGSGVTARYLTEAGIDRAMLLVTHVRFDGEPCVFGVALDVPGTEAISPEYGPRSVRERWKVEQWEPLTLSPSVNHPPGTYMQCQCEGIHGFIREGMWVSG